MADWDVARSSGCCDRCGCELAEGQEYCAALIEAPEGFERKDFCLDCWAAESVEHFCFWRSRVPVREKKAKLLVDDGVLINFFERLEDETDPLRVRFRFVLALILMRKKLLRYETTVREDDRELWQMRLAGTDTVHRVENPKMDDEQVTAVSGQLSAILRAGSVEDAADAMDPGDPPMADDVASPGPDDGDERIGPADQAAVNEEQPAE